jgi:hypothetical protein
MPEVLELPSGWTEKKDAYGRVFYADISKQTTSWDHPLKLKREAEEKAKREAEEAKRAAEEKAKREEEETKRAAEENAKQEAEEAKRAAEEASQAELARAAAERVAVAQESKRHKNEEPHSPVAQKDANPVLLVAQNHNVQNAVEYEGDTNDVGLPHGKGLMVYEGGTRHDGWFVQGKCKGPGVQHFITKCNFTGLFENNEKNGHGEYIFANGNKFKGEFKNDQRHGKVRHKIALRSLATIALLTSKLLRPNQGVYTYASGATFTGEWNMGKRVVGVGHYKLPGEDAIPIDDESK